MFAIKYLVLILSSFWLFGGEDESDKISEDTMVEQLDNKDDESEEAEASKEDEEAEDEVDKETEVVGPRTVSSDMTETTLTGPDDKEITALFENNAEPIEAFEGAEKADVDLEDVLKPKDEVTSYYSETFMLINAFEAESDEPADTDLIGLTAEINEEDELQVYSGQWYQEDEFIYPYAYADSDTLLYIAEDKWTDITGEAEAEEIYYGTYSSVYDALMESEDVIEIFEDDDNYYLINVGQEEVLHETFGSIYEVEFQNADEESQNNAVLAIVDKDSNEVSDLTYISNAKGLAEGIELQIEVAAKFDNYGDYDDGVTEPTEGEEIEVGEQSSENRSGVDASSTGKVEGETLTGKDGAEINSVQENNQGLSTALEEAEDTDVEIDEIFKDKSEIYSYYSEFDAMVRLIGESDDEQREETVKATAEIYEVEDELEVYSEVANNGEDLEPSVYASEEIYFQYDGSKWNDLSTEGNVEDVYNPTYSNMYDVFMENQELLDVKVDDDYYYLYNISNDMEIHDTFGQIFGAEINNGVEDEQVNAIVGVLDKETNELSQVTYISTAPSQNGEGAIHLEMSGIYKDYGKFDDDGITVPDEIYE